MNLLMCALLVLIPLIRSIGQIKLPLRLFLYMTAEVLIPLIRSIGQMQETLGNEKGVF